MKVLVTGSEGYLGSELALALMDKGHTVIGFDNSIYDNLSMRVATIFNDIRDGLSVSKAIQEVDAVIHLAAIVGDKACELDEDHTWEVNELATQTISDLCEHYGKRLIFASSCSVYGQAENKAFDEDSVVSYANLPIYAKGKLSAETDIEIMNINWDSKHVILRMGTLFGLSYRMRFDLAINRFVAMAYNNEPIHVFGGEQWRPFLHIQDAIQAYIMALENPRMSGIYNVASFNGTLADVGQAIADRYHATLTLDYAQHDKRSYQADISKIIKFGFKSKVGLLEGTHDIWKAFTDDQFTNYKDPRYDNYLSLKA